MKDQKAKKDKEKDDVEVLKYFYENAPQFYVIAAGSLLGVSLQKNNTFPVGKVDFLNLYPLSFKEFLINSNEEGLLLAIQSQNWSIVATFHDKLIQYLRIFYFIGGMPEAANHYFETKNFNQIRVIQKNILQGCSQICLNNLLEFNFCDFAS